MQNMTLELVLKIIVALLLPPAAAFWQARLGVHFWINLALTMIGWFPGVVHALWLILHERYKLLLVERLSQPTEPSQAAAQPTESSSELSQTKTD